MVGIHKHILPVFKAPKSTKVNAASKKCCGWEEPAICTFQLNDNNLIDIVVKKNRSIACIYKL
jgi:hypothetical protein